MKRALRTMLGAALLAVGFITSLSAIALPDLLLPKMDTPPALDGRLDDLSWRQAAQINEFQDADGKPAPVSEQTSVYLGYDNRCLYLSFDCREPNPAGIGMKAEAEKDIWASGDDVVAVFLQPNADAEKYYQFAATPKGIKFDQVSEGGAKESAAYNPAWEVKATVGTNSWIVEMAIPWEAFGIREEMGKVWRVNFCRYRSQNRLATAWAKVGSWHSPQAFGYLKGLIIESEAPAQSGLRLESVDLPKPELFVTNTLTGVLKNTSAQPCQGLLQVKVQAPSGKVTESVRPIEISAQASAPISADFQLQAEAGDHRLQLLVKGGSNGISLYRSPSAVIHIGQILDAYLDRDYYTDEPQAKVIPVFGFRPAQIKGLRLNVAVCQGEQSLIKQQLVWTPESENIPVKIGPLAIGDYQATVELRGAADTIIATKTLPLRKLKKTAGEVKTDQERLCLLVDGQPFFPISICAHFPLSQGYAERFFDDLKDSGFNLIAPLYESTHEVTPFLDLCLKNNLRVNYDVGYSYYLPAGFGHSLAPNMPADSPEKKKRDAIGDKVRPEIVKDVLRYKDHPALFAWYGIDEAGTAEEDESKKLYRDIRRVDPQHPVWITFCQEIPFTGGYDIINIDRYWNFMAGTPLTVAATVDRFLLVAWRMRKPVTILLCGSSWSGGRREISAGDNRVQTYLAVIHGARGIGYFTYRPLSESVWQEEKKLTRELRELSPVLLEPDLDNVIVSLSPQAPIHLTAKWHAGQLWLLAVNTLNTKVKQEFQIEGLKAGAKIREYFENRDLAFTQDNFTDSFDGYGSHVYTIKGIDRRAGYAIKTRSKIAAQKAAVRQRPKAPLAGQATNLILNSSGELCASPELPALWADGCWDWNWDRALLPRVDQSTAVDGCNSVLLQQPKRGNLNALVIPNYYQAKALAPDTPYTFSIYLKGDRDRIPVRLRFGGPHPMPAIKDKEATVEVGPEWQKFSFTRVWPKKEADDIQAMIGVAPQLDGVKVWVDAAQCEAGSQATPYVEDEITKAYWEGKY